LTLTSPLSTQYDHTLTKAHQIAAAFHLDQLEADIERLARIANGELGSEMDDDDYLTLRIYHYLVANEPVTDPAISESDYASYLAPAFLKP
jgi:hypothetical protein